MARPKESYPAVADSLEHGDEGYDLGRRFRLDQLDGGQYFFTTKQDLQDFANLHGFELVNEDEMARLRAAYDQIDDE